MEANMQIHHASLFLRLMIQSYQRFLNWEVTIPGNVKTGSPKYIKPEGVVFGPTKQVGKSPAEHGVDKERESPGEWGRGE